MSDQSPERPSLVTIIDLTDVDTGRSEALREQRYGRRAEPLPPPTPLRKDWLETVNTARKFYNPNPEARQEP